MIDKLVPGQSFMYHLRRCGWGLSFERLSLPHSRLRTSIDMICIQKRLDFPNNVRSVLQQQILPLFLPTHCLGSWEIHCQAVEMVYIISIQRHHRFSASIRTSAAECYLAFCRTHLFLYLSHIPWAASSDWRASVPVTWTNKWSKLSTKELFVLQALEAWCWHIPSHWSWILHQCAKQKALQSLVHSLFGLLDALFCLLTAEHGVRLRLAPLTRCVLSGSFRLRGFSTSCGGAPYRKR